MAYATVFRDFFTETVDTILELHTPNIGTSWTKQIDTGGTGVLLVGQVLDDVTDGGSELNEGILYVANGTYPSADYVVSAVFKDSAVGATDPYILCARLTDSNNMYALKVTDTTVQLHKKVASVWSTISTLTTIGAWANGDIFALRVLGTNIRAYRNWKVIVNQDVTDSSLTGIGKGGYGQGSIITAGDDPTGAQEIDDFYIMDLTAPLQALPSRKASGIGATNLQSPYNNWQALYKRLDYGHNDTERPLIKAMEVFALGREFVFSINDNTYHYILRRGRRAVGIETVNSGGSPVKTQLLKDTVEQQALTPGAGTTLSGNANIEGTEKINLVGQWPA